MNTPVETLKILAEIDVLLEKLNEQNVLPYLEAYITKHGVVLPRVMLSQEQLVQRLAKHIK
jgi:hypothetical protein